MSEHLLFSRVWAMPNHETFKVRPIEAFVKKYLKSSNISVDPFAGNNTLVTYTNDINPITKAHYHMNAEDFLIMLKNNNIICDLAILDPPYSPTQMSRSYKIAGIKCSKQITQNGKLYARVKSSLLPILSFNAIVLSFGWNSNGMGKKHKFEIIEIMLCSHGGAHNDTICIAERRLE